MGDDGPVEDMLITMLTVPSQDILLTSLKACSLLPRRRHAVRHREDMCCVDSFGTTESFNIPSPY